MEKSVKHLINYDPQNESIHDLVIYSLKNNYRDYVFSNKDKQIVLEMCQREQISLIYKENFDRYGDLDYVEFIPVKFLKGSSKKAKVKANQLNMKDLQSNPNKWKYTDLSKRTQGYIVQSRKE